MSYLYKDCKCPFCGRGPTRMGLTKKQALLVEFLESSRAYEGTTPSYQEMADAMDLKSKSGIHRLIVSLEERGVIRRLPHRARAIEVISGD